MSAAVLRGVLLRPKEVGERRSRFKELENKINLKCI